MGSDPFGISYTATAELAIALAKLKEKVGELALVLGGGNICRGLTLAAGGLARTPSDQIGMLATLMNGLALQHALEQNSLQCSLMSALDCPGVAESYDWHRARHLLSQGTLLIFVGGTGHPYFTTDTAAALRACEIEADLLLKATNVDGVYPKDPRQHPGLEKYETIEYSDVLRQKLAVMDATAVAMCQSCHLPIVVFNKKALHADNFLTMLAKRQIGTLIYGK